MIFFVSRNFIKINLVCLSSWRMPWSKDLNP
jgi:hypothetical protein